MSALLLLASMLCWHNALQEAQLSLKSDLWQQKLQYCQSRTSACLSAIARSACTRTLDCSAVHAVTSAGLHHLWDMCTTVAAHTTLYVHIESRLGQHITIQVCHQQCQVFLWSCTQASSDSAVTDTSLAAGTVQHPCHQHSLTVPKLMPMLPSCSK